MAEPSMNPQERVGRAPVAPRVVGDGPAAAAAEGDGGRTSYLPPLLLLLAGPAVLALVVLEAPSWLRAAPVLAYLATVPGLAVVRLLRLADRLMVALLGVALSLSLGAIVAQLMIYAGAWSPTLGVSTLVFVASIAASVEVFRAGGAR
ncbi:MAG TPA: hypothetical protein VGJ63_22615 [Micromonosporaceae bacterium]|jgi:hypothetical protein